MYLIYHYFFQIGVLFLAITSFGNDRHFLLRIESGTHESGTYTW